MASTTCGHCGRLAFMEAASGLHNIANTNGPGARSEAVYKCPNCHRLNMASQWDPHSGQSLTAVAGTESAANKVWTGASWLPRYRQVREFEDVPEHIAQAATEATLCLSVGSYRAVGSLARAVIEATAKDKNAEGRDLRARIDALRDADHIRRHTQEQAHEIRHFGNNMAHGDFVEPVTQQEAEEVIELMIEVLDEVYQSPARLSKLRAARLAKIEK